MKDDKFTRIIKSSLKEFSKHGYNKTSINAICNDAKVSKGLIFYHFGSKKELYIYLVKYVADLYTRAVQDNFDMNNTDFMAMIKKSTRVKIDIMMEYPYSYDFFMTVLKEEHQFKEVIDFLEEAQKVSSYELYTHIVNKIDISVFKDGIDVETALKVSTWISEGFLKEGKFDTVEHIVENIGELENLLKLLLYKE